MCGALPSSATLSMCGALQSGATHPARIGAQLSVDDATSAGSVAPEARAPLGLVWRP
jgi:hypothetical protein